MDNSAPIWDGFNGRGLTNGSFCEMHNSYRKLIAGTLQDNQDPMKVRALFNTYLSSIMRLSDFINQPMGYEQTATIAKLDNIRDLCYRAFDSSVDYLAKLPIDHPLYEAAHAVALAKSPYNGLNEHEYTKQTSEMDGLYRALMTNYQMELKINALGLNIIIEAAKAANDAIRLEFEKREAERGNRIAQKGDDSTESLKAEIADTFQLIVRRVNAVAELETESPDYGIVESFIQNANGIADHYRRILAQKNRKPGSEPEPEKDKKEDEGENPAEQNNGEENQNDSNP